MGKLLKSTLMSSKITEMNSKMSGDSKSEPPTVVGGTRKVIQQTEQQKGTADRKLANPVRPAKKTRGQPMQAFQRVARRGLAIMKLFTRTANKQIAKGKPPVNLTPKRLAHKSFKHAKEKNSECAVHELSLVLA